jgi:hypothetical protein
MVTPPTPLKQESNKPMKVIKKALRKYVTILESTYEPTYIYEPEIPYKHFVWTLFLLLLHILSIVFIILIVHIIFTLVINHLLLSTTTVLTIICIITHRRKLLQLTNSGIDKLFRGWERFRTWLDKD